MTPADGDGLVTSNEALADLALDDVTRADFEACWEILCAAPPPELAERHIRAAAVLAAKSAAQQPRFAASGRSLAKAAVISAAAFVGTTGLAAADVLPPAAAHVVESVANTVRTAVDPMPSELSLPTPVPAPVARVVEATAEVAGSAAIDPTTTEPTDPTTSLPLASTTTTTVTTLVAATTTTVGDDGTEPGTGSTTTTTTIPDDGTATAAGTGSTTTTEPSSTTSTTQPSSTTTTTPPPTTTP